MKIVKTYNWNVNSEAKEIKFNNNLGGDTVISEVYVQTLSDCAFTAEGYVDEEKDAVKLKVINMGSFDTTDAPSAKGLYLIMAGSLEKLKLTFSGSAEVIVKTVY